MVSEFLFSRESERANGGDSAWGTPGVIEDMLLLLSVLIIIVAVVIIVTLIITFIVTMTITKNKNVSKQQHNNNNNNWYNFEITALILPKGRHYELMVDALEYGLVHQLAFQH